MCDHIVGRAFTLNPEEGAAWITPLVPASKKHDFPEGDWIYRFPYCPLCGTHNGWPEGTSNMLGEPEDG